MRAAGALLCVFLLAMVPLRALGEGPRWQELKGKHFVIYFEDDKRSASEVLRYAETYYHSIVGQLGFRRLNNFWLWERRATIKLYKTRSGFSDATGAPPWAVAKVNLQDRAIEAYGSSESLLRSRLPHEMAHLIFREYIGFKGEVPLWLDEGVAQWCELGARKEPVPVLKRRISLRVLTGMDIRKEDDKQLVLLYYTQAASLVRYLVEQHGQERFAMFCRQMRDGKSLDGALRFTYPHTIPSIESLERQWIAWQSVGNERAVGKEKR
jgi:hypothetical protein